jgi:hypothetical protein
MIASSTRNCSGAGVVKAGRIREANSASMVASIVSVLASLPIARAKSRTCLGFTTAIGSFASAHARSKGCSRPPVLSHVTSLGLHFLAYFTNFLMPTGVFSNSRISADSRLNTSSLGLLMSTPMKTSFGMVASWNLVSNIVLPCEANSRFWQRPKPARCCRGVKKPFGLFWKRGSTTISLTVDLLDQGAIRSAVLSPTTNLQGAVL